MSFVKQCIEVLKKSIEEKYYSVCIVRFKHGLYICIYILYLLKLYILLYTYVYYMYVYNQCLYLAIRIYTYVYTCV